jgi:hypothetical protein
LICTLDLTSFRWRSGTQLVQPILLNLQLRRQLVQPGTQSVQLVLLRRTKESERKRQDEDRQAETNGLQSELPQLTTGSTSPFVAEQVRLKFVQTERAEEYAQKDQEGDQPHLRQRPGSGPCLCCSTSNKDWCHTLLMVSTLICLDISLSCLSANAARHASHSRRRVSEYNCLTVGGFPTPN